MQQQLMARLSQSAAPKALLDVSKLPPGSKLMATVVASLPADRPQLMDYLKTSKHDTAPPETPVQNKTTSGPTKLTLEALNNLLAKPQLYSVQLKILGKSLVTFSEKPLPTAQKIDLFVRNDGQLQLANKEQPLQTQSQNAKSIPENHIKAEGKPLSTLEGKANQNTLTAKDLEILHSGLKRYLPSQGKISDTLSQLQKIDSLLKTHTNFLEKVGYSGNIQQVLRLIDTMVARSPVMEDIIRPQTLKRTIENSGVLLESKITAAKSFVNNTNGGSDVKTISPHQAGRDNVSIDLQKDTKAELLRLLNLIASVTSPSSIQGGKQTHIPSNIDKLILDLFSTKQGQQVLPNIADQQSFAKNLQPAIFSSLAKISSLQIRHLIQSHSEGSFSSTGGLFELPVRVGDYVFPLTLHIHEKSPEEKNSKEKKENDKKRESMLKRCWHVYMEFDLDELGLFASDIAVQDQHIKTKLWVQAQSLWSESRENLDVLKSDLNKKGIEVDELICLRGKPPEKSIKINSSLVDIRT